ncbi:hypothetical protein H8E88_05665 [candidate division KSB1 bacterium]|nr:hypothetical protein [candidate division KSB1 bacterium]MBL7095192.1 hypothetical protein [candidate division KSB1 bacterium]
MKYKVIIGIVSCCALLTNSAFTQTLPQKLITDIEDGQLDNFSLIEAAFIISGAGNTSRLNQGVSWFYDLIEDINEKTLVGFEKTPSAERLFMYFHTTWLKEYKKKATTLFDILERKEYNCVAATVLYNLTCDELGLTTHAFETPTHVYTIFSNFSEMVMVENTTSRGFNIMKNLKNYSKYLLRYYPQNQALKIGLDRIYYYENSKGREITNTELLGLICYNLSLFNTENKNYEKAYQYVELAQLFNQDSRSNIKFEKQLYYRWAQQLFEQKKFYQAFEVTADAYYRYPDNSDFKNNCKFAFTNALLHLWKSKDWNKTEQIILEMDDLAIRSNRESVFQKKILSDWIKFLSAQKRTEETQRAVELFNMFK